MINSTSIRISTRPLTIEKHCASENMEKFKIHFAKAVTKNQKRSGTKREIVIANQVKELVENIHNNTETLVKLQFEQAQTIEEITACPVQLENTKVPTGQSYGAQVPSKITP